MSYFNPKVLILKRIIKKKLKTNKENTNKTEENSKEKSKIKNKSEIKKAKTIHENDIDTIIKKRKYENAINEYLSLKEISYLRELKEQKIKEEFKFDDLNFSFNKFIRERNTKNNIIINKKKELNELKIDSTFEKIWKKISIKNYGKFINDYNYSKDKNNIILRKIKKNEKINSMINIKIKNTKKIFENKMLRDENKKKEKEIKDEKDPLIFLIRRNNFKNRNKSINYKNFDKNYYSCSNKNINDNINKRILNRTNFTTKINEPPKSLSQNNIRTIKIKKININHENKNNQNNRRIRKVYFNNYSRNRKIPNFVLESESKKTDLIQEYEKIIKTNKKLKLNYLKNNNIIPYNQIDSIIKTRKKLMTHYLKIKYIKDNHSIYIKNKNNIRKKEGNFKERLIKSAEKYFNDDTTDI